MAVAYDIKAIPTVYGARQFRSRLEAKWAAFFEEAGWQFEYEPFDLGEWSPDFLLRGKIEVLVEVKPIASFDKDTAAKMERAAVAGRWDGELMLVGVAPMFSGRSENFSWSCSIGWLGERDTWGAEYRDSFSFDPCAACVAPNGLPDFHSNTLSYTGRMFGQGHKENDYPSNADWLKRIWDRAANRVQWNKK